VTLGGLTVVIIAPGVSFVDFVDACLITGVRILCSHFLVATCGRIAPCGGVDDACVEGVLNPFEFCFVCLPLALFLLLRWRVGYSDGEGHLADIGALGRAGLAVCDHKVLEGLLDSIYFSESNLLAQY
jgi:hypothetical protein